MNNINEVQLCFSSVSSKLYKEANRKGCVFIETTTKVTTLIQFEIKYLLMQLYMYVFPININYRLIVMGKFN